MAEIHFEADFCVTRNLKLYLQAVFFSVLNAQIEDVIDDIISLESSLNDEFMTLIDSGLQLPNTVCSNILNFVKDQLSNASAFVIYFLKTD